MPFMPADNHALDVTGNWHGGSLANRSVWAHFLRKAVRRTSWRRTPTWFGDVELQLSLFGYHVADH